MTYDEKIEKAETIIAEATSLLKQCKDELTAINADNSPT